MRRDCDIETCKIVEAEAVDSVRGMSDHDEAVCELVVVANAFEKIVPDASGNVPVSQIDELIADANIERGFYKKNNPETGRLENGNPVGWVLRSTVTEYRRTLLRIDSSRNE